MDLAPLIFSGKLIPQAPSLLTLLSPHSPRLPVPLPSRAVCRRGCHCVSLMLPSEPLRAPPSRRPAASFVPSPGSPPVLLILPGLCCREGPRVTSDGQHWGQDLGKSERACCPMPVWASRNEGPRLGRIFICSVCFLRTVHQIMPSVQGAVVWSQPVHFISGGTAPEGGSRPRPTLCSR